LYVVAQIHAGNTKEADVLLRTISDDGVVDSPTLLNVYVQKKMYDRALDIWKLRIKKYPKSTDAYFALGATYKLMGNNTQAIKSVRTILEINPTLKPRVDAFIEGL
jgi:tetratricopeptide (TPR) repeat protein